MALSTARLCKRASPRLQTCQSVCSTPTQILKARICSFNTSPIPFLDRLWCWVRWPIVRAELGQQDGKGWRESSGLTKARRGIGERGLQELRAGKSFCDCCYCVLGVSLLSSAPPFLPLPAPFSFPFPWGRSEVEGRSPTTIGSISNHLPTATPQVPEKHLQDRTSPLPSPPVW